MRGFFVENNMETLKKLPTKDLKDMLQENHSIAVKAFIRAELLNRNELQEEIQQRSLPIGSVIASDEFKNAIKEAVKSGVYEDWGHGDEGEYSFDAFDEDVATNTVIEVLNKHLL